MATYPVVNTKTGEQKEVMMSITEWDQWEWKDKLRKKAPGWNDILNKAKRNAPRNNTIKTI